MTNSSIYKDIAERTGGDIYIGVVGPVRTGKSTFIKNFCETLVIPNITHESMKERAKDELPQSAAGKTIMTTEPKFVPEESVSIELDGNAHMNVRLIDCVGYIVPSSLGYIEDEQPRMVRTPWFDHEIPFNTAAEIGTKKVICEHSTIGLVVTTDGSISDIPREEYEQAEQRVIEELMQLNKPFVVLLNCMYPLSADALELSGQMSEKYGVPVVPVNCLEITEDEIKAVLTAILYRFPVKEISFNFPNWVLSLDREHPIRAGITGAVKSACANISCLEDVAHICNDIQQSEYITDAKTENVNMGDGSAVINAQIKRELFYQVLSEQAGLDVSNDQELMLRMRELNTVKREYDRIKDALDEVEATGYGIVMPTVDELELKEPEIVKQGGRYGVKLCASAPSIHMLRADITTEVAPVVGTESQSEELVSFLLKEFEEDPAQIWNSNIFGKSLNELVNEGLRNKLYHMPADARGKLQETLERVINEGCNGLICIIL